MLVTVCIFSYDPTSAVHIQTSRRRFRSNRKVIWLGRYASMCHLGICSRLSVSLRHLRAQSQMPDIHSIRWSRMRGPQGSVTQRVGKPWVAGVTGGVCALLAIACGASTHPRSSYAKASSTTSYADYPVLQAGDVSRIDVVSLAHAHRVVNSKARPIWVAVDPQNAAATLPEIGTAHEVRHEGLLRIWAAKSDRGGLCLLIFDPALSDHPATAHSVTASCGVASELQRGIALVQHIGALRTGTSFLIGLAPSRVSRVLLSFGDGSFRLLPVSNNSYSITTHHRMASVSFVHEGVRQQVIP